MRDYKPEIDGLRTVAVVPVVLFHTGLGLPGGYIGVDVFFVISGYLITRIINGEMAGGTFSFIGFYERRARRILPALFALIIVTTAAAGYLLLAPEFELYGKSVIATLLFASNLWFWVRGGNYFAPGVETEPLLHTWSLAVEEQFYIFFPIILLLLRKLWPGHLNAAVVTLVILSLVASAGGIFIDAIATFYLIPTRAWELGIGCLLALVSLPALDKPKREVVALLGLASILVPLVLYTSETRFPGLAAAPPVLGSAAIIWVASCGPTLVTKLLSTRAFVFVGLISYSLYLWHWPVIVYLKIVMAQNELPPAAQAVALAASFILAWLSWRYVERPFRSRQQVSRGGIFTWSVAATAMIGATAATVVAARGLPDRFGPDVQLYARAAGDFVPCPGQQLRPGYCLVGDAKARPSMLLWGDSHAQALAPALAAAAERKGAAALAVTHDSCPPLLGVRRPERPLCAGANEAVVDHLRSHPELHTVIIAARWPLWRSGERAAGETGRPNRIFDQEPDRHPNLVFDLSLRRTLATMKKLRRRVVVVGGVPEIGWHVPYRLLSQMRFGVAAPAPPSRADMLERNGAVNAVLQKAVSRAGGLFLDPSATLCRQRCMVTEGGTPIYKDDDHLTATFARERVAPFLAPVLARPVPPSELNSSEQATYREEW